MNVCPRCDLVCKSADILRRHEVHVHQRQFPYHCSLCGKGVATRVNLIGHMATRHNVKKHFECEFCNRAFGYKRSLEDHINNIHMGWTPPVPDCCYPCCHYKIETPLLCQDIKIAFWRCTAFCCFISIWTFCNKSYLDSDVIISKSNFMAHACHNYEIVQWSSQLLFRLFWVLNIFQVTLELLSRIAENNITTFFLCAVSIPVIPYKLKWYFNTHTQAFSSLCSHNFPVPLTVLYISFRVSLTDQHLTNFYTRKTNINPACRTSRMKASPWSCKSPRDRVFVLDVISYASPHTYFASMRSTYTSDSSHITAHFVEKVLQLASV